MRKISLCQSLDEAYSIADSNLAELKSAMIGLCISIERQYKIAFDTEVNEGIDYQTYRRILYVYPRFGELTIEQFNRLMILFINIRNVNAHLYFSKPIYLDEDLKRFILNNVKPSFQIENEKKITIYGAVLILAFLAQKYMIWPFCTSFFRSEFFAEIDGGVKMSNFQVDQQKIFNSICGLDKPLTQNGERVSGVDATYINDVLKRTLTLVFFDLEKALIKKEDCSNKKIPFQWMLKKSMFDDALISKIVKLRNCWFHGSFIGDTISQNDGKFEFTLDFVINVLIEIIEAAKKDPFRFGFVLNDVRYVGQSFFNYYFLRLIELSYKVLDNRLLTDGKLDNRLDNIGFVFKKIEEVDPLMFDKFASLLDCDEIGWSLSTSKFIDKIPRTFNSKNFRIVKLHSESGFKIGNYSTERKEIVLGLVDIDQKYKNLVNDRNLDDLNGTEEQRCSKFVSVISFSF